MPGRVHDEATPATADVEETLARLQPQLTAQQIELARLGGVEAFVLVREDAAGIDHARAEDVLEEFVGHVVVVADRLLVALARMDLPLKLRGLPAGARAI